MDLSESKWKESIKLEGARYANKLFAEFHSSLKKAELFLPLVTNNMKLGLMEVMLDALIGGAVNVASTYVSTEPDFEENFIERVRTQFQAARQQRLKLVK